ncbi:hypothetical protein K502DRAFT_168509 [Neoconidiobolus thromboides FSU 785]|nr:hypothetical protein K502DRAFT_168509 [Neoconidiobolus thromboides FSU 785]
MASLSEIIRKKFLSSVQEASTYGHKLKRVIMDHESYSLYLRVLPSEALLDYNIVDISLIDLHTNCQETIESNKGFIGIYFLFSIDKSFNMLFEQFPMNNESVFTKAHLFFLGVIPPIRFSQLAKRADKYWLSLKELNIDYYRKLYIIIIVLNIC